MAGCSRSPVLQCSPVLRHTEGTGFVATESQCVPDLRQESDCRPDPHRRRGSGGDLLGGDLLSNLATHPGLVCAASLLTDYASRSRACCQALSVLGPAY